MENIAKITFIISISAFVAASATVASVSGAVRISAPANGTIFIPESKKLYPLANTSRSAPAMLLPKALDKAVADDVERRATDVVARKAALVTMQRGVIRLR